MRKLLPILVLSLLNVGCASLTKTDTHPGMTYWDLVHLGNHSGEALKYNSETDCPIVEKYCSHPRYKNTSMCKITLTEEEKLEIDYYLIFGDE